MERLLNSTTETMARLGCKHTKLFELIAKGALDARKMGHRTMITEESLRRYAESLPRIEPRRSTAEADTQAQQPESIPAN